MNTQPALYQAGGADLMPGDARRSGRQISRVNGRGLVRRSEIDIETDVVLCKSDSITTVAGTMMGDIVRVAQAQAQFEALVPQASGRLNAIADNHALDLMALAADHRCALRRL